MMVKLSIFTRDQNPSCNLGFGFYESFYVENSFYADVFNIFFLNFLMECFYLLSCHFALSNIIMYFVLEVFNVTNLYRTTVF